MTPTIARSSSLVAGCLAVLGATACNGGPDNTIRKLQPAIAVVTADPEGGAVDFGEVVVQYDAQQSFQIVNAGKAELVIEDITIVDNNDGVYTLEPSSGTVPKDDSLTVEVGFAPATYVDYARTIVITSNDPDAPTLEVPLLGEGVDGPVPDISIDKGSLDFGDVPSGEDEIDFFTITNAGDGPLVIDRIDQSGSGDFTIVTAPTSGSEIAPGSSTQVIVQYAPPGEAGANGKLVVTSNDPDEESVEVLLVGNGGSDDVYPEAVIDCPESVTPLDFLTLDGRDSYDPQGLEPLTYAWSVATAPPGSTSAVADPTADYTELFVDMAGLWEVQLKVANSAGLQSAPETCQFFAIPESNIHVELTWNTGNSDVDLHLVQGGYDFFDCPQDCNYDNPNPDWGQSGDGDDPVLALDNQAGYGPENINLENPASGDYEVKVHYFADKGGGTTTATVKVWLNGSLAGEYSEVLTNDELWEVGYVKWPDAVFVEQESEPAQASRHSCRWE